MAVVAITIAGPTADLQGPFRSRRPEPSIPIRMSGHAGRTVRSLLQCPCLRRAVERTIGRVGPARMARDENTPHSNRSSFPADPDWDGRRGEQAQDAARLRWLRTAVPISDTAAAAQPAGVRARRVL